MPKKIDARELTSFGRTDVENEIEELIDVILNQPKIPTMGKKLIVEAATTGHYPGRLWQYFGFKHMPPQTVDEQATNIIECIKAGAAAIHTHPRDPEDEFNYETHVGRDMAPELVKEVMDRVYREADFVPLNHAWHPRNWADMAEADFITPTRELLEIGKGNRYIQGNVIPTWIYPKSRRGLLSSWFTADSLREGITFLEENNVKPLVALEMERLVWFKSNVLDRGVFKTSPHINIQEGKHGQNRSSVDPWAHINLISSIETVRATIPDCTIGLHAGGRNWLPLTAIGIMMGVDLVRTGIEDQFWCYPHKDLFLKKPSEAVKKVVQIARALGRDLASPSEAREILGIKPT